jgi:Nickel responsive protein SCO4226-like
MPRYVVERSFPQGLAIPIDAQGKQQCERIVATNAEHEFTWVHSYVSADRTRTYCVYDARSPEAIRHVADRNGLPVDRITEVRVLDPYFYA